MEICQKEIVIHGKGKHLGTIMICPIGDETRHG
jgi:hypothetical protein